MYQTKAAAQSVTVVAQVLAIAGILAQMNGHDISAEVAGLPEAVGAAVDTATILALQLVSLWGRLRANTTIKGWFSSK